MKKYVVMALLVPHSNTYKIYGPFLTASDADLWAEENLQNGHSIIEIHEVSPALARPTGAKRQYVRGSNVARTFAWDRKWERASE